MKALLIGEQREGKLLGATYETIAFAQSIGAESAMFLVGSEGDLPKYDGKLYLADPQKHGELNPDTHKQLILDTVEKEKPDMVVFAHSYYGWDIAPRVTFALKGSPISEVVGYKDGVFTVPACNGKLHRDVKPVAGLPVVTLQSAAFGLTGDPSGAPSIEKVSSEVESAYEFTGFEAPESTGIDLTKAEIIVSAGRGIGKKDNIDTIKKLAEAIKGELGASRPVVDSGWVEYERQVGISGQTVSPKLYIACGISGAIQHLAGMKRSEFVVAINKDKDAPIGEVADVLIVADLNQFVPVLTEKLTSL